MEMTPVFVLADNGLFYRDPCISGDNWFLRFHEDGRNELVLKLPQNRRPALDELVKTVDDILKEMGILIHKLCGVREIQQAFGAKPELQRACSIHLDIRRPIPAKLFGAKKGIWQPIRPCVIADFGHPWG